MRDTGNMLPQARARARSALQAHAPLARKIFGSSQVEVASQLRLADALLESRLVYATET